ncbi:Uma2 family endonuclease [Roseofilum sp. BLCC_M91]|uniref:Uma2 family endonuclease n=1 Tax=Roseofilum halophilum BLCC-M91 TaxID=3022259 RepID=A0ABT7BSC2_9CYAN|nr:Uma2 family endonuclease [Roseofilum halophilum]MDJ1181401.1 Uma2 family endonuclease [Roseofilum halophilum BLCC-M91]
MPLPTITEDIIALEPGDELILRFRTWQDYEELLTRRQDKAGLRIRYNSNTQEIRIMSPLPRHGKDVDLLADFVKILLRQQGKDWDSFQPITLKRINQQGIEPDHCFYIDNRLAVLGKERIDLETDPAPDLVIEVDLTSMTEPENYQAIAPSELWIYRENKLHIYHFSPEGYQEVANSRWFPECDLNDLIPRYIERGWEMGSSVAMREFEDAVR